MAEVIWGLATSHVPSIGAAMDRGRTEDPQWRGLFEGYGPARVWLADHRPVVAIVVYVIQYPQPTAARCYAWARPWAGRSRAIPRTSRWRCWAPGACRT